MPRFIFLRLIKVNTQKNTGLKIQVPVQALNKKPINGRTAIFKLSRKSRIKRASVSKNGSVTKSEETDKPSVY